VEEEEQIENTISRELRTMLPYQVWKDLTEFAKACTKTGLGKWDYGVAVRLLLENSNNIAFYQQVSIKMIELENRIAELENQGVKAPIEVKEVRTLGGVIHGNIK